MRSNMKNEVTAGVAQPEEVIGADGVSEADVVRFLNQESGDGSQESGEESQESGDGSQESGEEGSHRDAEATETEEGEKEEGTGTEKAREKLPPELQEIFDRRIGKEVAKRKTLEDQLEAERAAKAEAEAEREELRARLSANETAAEDANPDLYASEEALAKREEKLWTLRTWAKRHPDGFDGDEKAGVPAYTAAQIRDAVAKYEEELFREIPRAKDAVRRRAEYDATVTAKVYPDVLKPGTKDGMIAKAFLQRFPVLKTLPDVHVIIGDMIAGERARAKGTGKTGEETLTEAQRAQRAGKTVVRAPAGTPGRRVVQEEPKKGINMKNLAERGFSLEAVAEALDN
jgi:hypothetical protein